MPTFGWPQDRLLLLIAGGENALLRAVEGAEDEDQQAIELVRGNEIGGSDVTIAVAARKAGSSFCVGEGGEYRRTAGKSRR